MEPNQTETENVSYNTAFIVLETNKGTIVANAIDFKDKTVQLEELLDIDHAATDNDLDRIISEIFMYRASQSETVRNILLTLVTRAAGHLASSNTEDANVKQ